MDLQLRLMVAFATMKYARGLVSLQLLTSYVKLAFGGMATFFELVVTLLGRLALT
ncbi:unnamed protein product [Heligmosomoides polygyrus]|uniref:Uncharacterized protein n=1 Tax=Heligmosomoides polygyrus TaxID=6339 RepID=A0A3P7Y5P5_HELPZ|nr:unnamed protein product [Heligmosomoides polygyrus]